MSDWEKRVERDIRFGRYIAEVDKWKLYNDCAEKLEAIRGLIPKLKCDRCVSWVGEPCPETCEHLIYKKIREVLG